MGFQFQPPSAWRPPQLRTSHGSKPASSGERGSWLAPQEAQYTLTCSLPSDYELLGLAERSVTCF